MATYLLKKSYQLKDLKEIKFKDLWGEHGIFTTMWVFGKPTKILFFEPHINNLIKSLKKYGIKRKFLKRDILKILNENLSKRKRYNNLLRIALTKKVISISLRKRISPRLDFTLRLVDFKREKPLYKNLKYKKILSYLSKLNTAKEDIALCVNKKILETGTSNLLFVSKNKIYSPKTDYYSGVNLRFYQNRISIIKKDIYTNNLDKFEEILLVGSGKGVVSVKFIESCDWKRKSKFIYNKLFNIFKKELNKKKYIFK